MYARLQFLKDLLVVGSSTFLLVVFVSVHLRNYFESTTFFPKKGTVNDSHEIDVNLVGDPILPKIQKSSEVERKSSRVYW